MSKILVADDEPMIVEMVKMRLEAVGYEVIPAYDGEEVLQKVAENPDLILLDVMMPKLDGFETARKLKGDPTTQGIPIIMFTARSESQATEQAIEAGADDYVVKPFNPRILLDKIKGLLPDA